MTTRKAHLLIALMWIISIVIVLLFMIPSHDYGETCFVIVFSDTHVTSYSIWLFLILFQYIPFIALFFCCLRVYMIASRFKQAVELQLQRPDASYNVQLRYHLGRLVSECHENSCSSPEAKVSDQTIIVCQGTDTNMVKSKRLYKWMTTAVKQRKVAILITCIVTASGVCWFSASTIYVMSWFCASCGVRGTWLQYIHPWLLYVNSAINPVLLLLMSDDFRKGLRYTAFSCIQRITAKSMKQQLAIKAAPKSRHPFHCEPP
jgi:hypothetical protein